MCVFSDSQCRGWFICILNWTTSVGVGRKTISYLFTVISCIFYEVLYPLHFYITPVITGADFCPGRSARHFCGMFWALQNCWCISAVVFSFTCWISQNHTIIEAGKDLWDPRVQPPITTQSTHTWVLCKKSLPLLPLKSLQCLCNAALGMLWFSKEVPAALEQNQGLCPRRRKHCSQERLLNLKRAKQLLVWVWICVPGSVCVTCAHSRGCTGLQSCSCSSSAFGRVTFFPCLWNTGVLHSLCWELLFPGWSSQN